MTAMEGWETGILGSLCSIEIGGTPSRSNPDYWDSAKETTNHWVSIRDLNRRVVSHTAEHITDIGARHSNVKLQKIGTVLLSFKLSIGRVAFAGCDLYTNEAIAGLCSEELDSEFLFYGLQQWDLLQNVDQAIKGATLNKEKLKQIEFQYPVSRKVQTQIASILSTLDRAIEQTEAIIAKQQRIKAGLMQDLLTKGIDENGVIRSEATHQFKDSPLGQIPVEWEVELLGRIASLQRGYDIVETQLIPGPAPVISSSGVIGYHNLATSTGPNVVVGRKGSIGNVHYVKTDFWAHDTSLFVTNFYGNNVKYVYYLFTSLDLGRYGTKSGSPSLNRNDIHPLQVGLPKPIEQERIADVFSTCDENLCRFVNELKKMKRIKAGLMHDLLTGTVRVN